MYELGEQGAGSRGGSGCSSPRLWDPLEPCGRAGARLRAALPRGGASEACRRRVHDRVCVFVTCPLEELIVMFLGVKAGVPPLLCRQPLAV